MKTFARTAAAALLLAACGSACPEPAPASGDAPSAGGERSNRNRSDARSPEAEAHRLGAIVEVSQTPRSLFDALADERYEDPGVEAARATCVAAAARALEEPETNPFLAECSRLLVAVGAVMVNAEPHDQTYQGELTDSDPRVPDDDSPYDEYTLEADAGWTIAADMTSTDFDTYLWLIGPDGSSLVQDDDGGEGTNSRFAYTTHAAGTYTVRANSYDGAGRGAYTLHIIANPG